MGKSIYSKGITLTIDSRGRKKRNGAVVQYGILQQCVLQYNAQQEILQYSAMIYIGGQYSTLQYNIVQPYNGIVQLFVPQYGSIVFNILQCIVVQQCPLQYSQIVSTMLQFNNVDDSIVEQYGPSIVEQYLLQYSSIICIIVSSIVQFNSVDHRIVQQYETQYSPIVQTIEYRNSIHYRIA